MAAKTQANRILNTSPAYSKQLRNSTAIGLVTLFALIVLIAYLMPFAYMGLTSVKNREQIVEGATGSVLPMSPVTFTYEQIIFQAQISDVSLNDGLIALTYDNLTVGRHNDVQRDYTAYLTQSADIEYIGAEINTESIEHVVTTSADSSGLVEVVANSSLINIDAGGVVPEVGWYISVANTQDFTVYNIPDEDGTVNEWAMIQSRRRGGSIFVDVDNPEAGTFTAEGDKTTLNEYRATFLDPQLDNFGEAWTGVEYPKLLRNTLVIAILGLIGTIISSVVVAYGFARFPIPGKNILFLILMGTIILPRQVVLVPTFAVFSALGWTGTWLPLIVPHFFSNAYNVFLMRQYFMGIPRELDEAAMIDGAGPFRILISVIIPQSWPVIVAVGLFHFVFAWNDYFEPLIYLAGNRELAPISIGIQQFNFQFNQKPEMVQATAILGLIIPVMIFILAQRVFMQGVVITGVDK